MLKLYTYFQKIRPRLRSFKQNANTKTLKISSDTVFLVSYPRSGNTWMRYMLANLINPASKWNINNIGNAIPDIYQNNINPSLRVRPLIIKSHESFRAEYPRVIYLYRDGRDVCVSLYDFYQKLQGYNEGFTTFILAMLQGGFDYGSWQDHVNSWLFMNKKNHILPIKYETLCEDTLKILADVTNFLGLKCDKIDLEIAISKSTFEKQKNDFYTYKHNTHWLKGFQGGVKGAPGKWREIFNDNQIELFWNYAGDTANKLGYEKNY